MKDQSADEFFVLVLCDLLDNVFLFARLLDTLTIYPFSIQGVPKKCSMRK